jgi:RNA polymerase sigma-70 factor (ECF subfamily)
MVDSSLRDRGHGTVSPGSSSGPPDTAFDRARPPLGFSSFGPRRGGRILKPGEPLDRSKPAAEEPAAAAPGDEALVARARAGDAEAFRALVERYRDRVYGLALRIVRSTADAEEVAQDAFVRAWLALPRFRGEASFSTWIYRIAVRCAFDRARTLKLRRGREARIEAAGEAAVPGAGPERTALALDLERLVETLPPSQRAAVTLYYLLDRSVEQVAAALEMPENTVKTHLSRARRALRTAWTARGGTRTR